MIKNRSIAFKLIFSISLSGALILLIIFGYNYSVTRKIVLKNLRENAGNLALSRVNHIDGVLKPVERLPESIARYIERLEPDSQNLFDQLKTIVENPEIYGSAIAFQPYRYDKNSLYYCPYVYIDGDSIRTTFLGGENYQYFYWDWYQIPAMLDRAVWSEPYFDEGGGSIVMSTYSVPFYSYNKGEKIFRGIITADISLEWLQEIVNSIKIYDTGFGFLISKNGTIVTYPDKRYVMNETIFSIAETLQDSTLRAIGRKMIAGETGFVPLKSGLTENKAWLYYTPLLSSGWSLGVLFPEKEIMADFRRLSAVLIILGIVGLILLSTAVTMISTATIKPLRELAAAAEKVGAGDLNCVLHKLKFHDEVGQLNESFSKMIVSLNEYIRELTEAAAARERIESELKIASDIQMSIIPRTFPPFPDKTEFALYAYLKPAREVGGDYYDFFFVDDENLCLTIADVSGKGVPAALYMAVTRTLIRSRISPGMNPAEILYKINKNLSEDNTSTMFVTLFLSILNIKTGTLQFANGGHNIPFIISADGDVSSLGESDGMILGIDPDFEFTNNTVKLSSGDSVFMYTDGITEAENIREELYSKYRLSDCLKANPLLNPKEITESVLKDVKRFIDGVDQSDDITILSLKYYG